MKKRASSKPVARKSAAKRPATAKTKSKPKAKAAGGPTRNAARVDPGRYVPTPIQGIGWAPFRYPL